MPVKYTKKDRQCLKQALREEVHEILTRKCSKVREKLSPLQKAKKKFRWLANVRNRKGCNIASSDAVTVNEKGNIKVFVKQNKGG